MAGWFATDSFVAAEPGIGSVFGDGVFGDGVFGDGVFGGNIFGDGGGPTDATEATVSGPEESRFTQSTRCSY